ncbi:hypothetical protein [Nitrospirillum sp. BR 11163]|uniref:hypothetical protein n=1 Tax=Nitrospirillum sp. BR 11163 TaxID=3104323 RepID=UPI002AFEAF06|nr:hypothetical protein [Nitrospirillum sp. BR 11163]MEA1677406.1 hypothetical protein [Nitrospirillum sp. BR 11163]
MNLERFKRLALELEDEARHYAAMDPQVKCFAGSVEGITADAKTERILAPLDHIPGDYYFYEGTLRQYRDLESAFARFRIEVIGGETPAVKAALDAIRATKP